MSLETAKLINTIANCITALSTLIVALLAGYGVLWEWKKQMKGKTEYEIARRYLKTALQLRDAIKFVRNPFIPVGEMQSALKDNGLDSEEYKNREKTNRAVYSIRWKKVMEAQTNMEAELLEAEVSWGINAVNAQKKLNGLVLELRSALMLYLEESLEVKDKDMLIYDTGDEDEFSKKVKIAIEEIEVFLKPYLK